VQHAATLGDESPRLAVVKGRGPAGEVHGVGEHVAGVDGLEHSSCCYGKIGIESVLWNDFSGRQSRDEWGVDTEPSDAGRTARRTQWAVTSGQRLVKERGVVGEVLELIVRQIGLVFDRIDAAYQLAGATVHAFVGIDVERAFTFVDAVHRTFLHAGLVHHVDTTTTDHIGHGTKLRADPSVQRGNKGRFRRD
jgi:hypothetical protein